MKKIFFQLNSFRSGMVAMFAIVMLLSACSHVDDNIVTPSEQTNAAYEKSIIRLKEPLILKLAVNNAPRKSTLRSFPGYTEDELQLATINQDNQGFDRVNTLLIDELQPKDYQIISGSGGSVSGDETKKVKSIDLNDNAPQLKLMAVPASGIITIYANVTDPKDSGSYSFGNNINDRSKEVSNQYHFVDFESMGRSRLVNETYNPLFDGDRDTDKMFHGLFEPARHIPMSVRFFNCSVIGGKLYAAYNQSHDAQEIGTIYLERAYALLNITFLTPLPGEPEFEYCAYTFYNYPYYFSYIAGDFDELRTASGFGYSKGQKISEEQTIDPIFSQGTENPSFFIMLPENNPQKKSEQLFLKLRVKESGKYVIRDIPLGVRQRNGLLKITRNQKYEAKVAVYVDGISLINYKVIPFVEKMVNVPTFE